MMKKRDTIPSTHSPVPFAAAVFMLAVLGGCNNGGEDSTAPVPVQSVSNPPTVDALGLNAVCGAPALADLCRDITGDAVDPLSDTWRNNNSPSRSLHPDFDQRQYGIPFSIVRAGQAMLPIRQSAPWASAEGDPGPYPMATNTRIEGDGLGGDSHALAYDVDAKKLYELYHASTPDGGKSYDAEIGAIFDFSANGKLRPANNTSADAAGLPILPLLARVDEVLAGGMKHAIRMTFQNTSGLWIAPARHQAETISGGVPMGARARLNSVWYEANKNNYSGHARSILDTMRNYGVVNADNGSSWYITGAPDPRWDATLGSLASVPAAAFEFVTAPAGWKISGPATLAVGETGVYTFSLLPAGDVEPGLEIGLSDSISSPAVHSGTFDVDRLYFDTGETAKSFRYTATAAGTVQIYTGNFSSGRYGGSPAAGSPYFSHNGHKYPSVFTITVR